MANKQFKAESKRLLDLMINSIYTNKEIFLRELISNGSDAIDKLHYRSLTDDKIEVKQSDFAIRIDIDKANRNLTISDNGCGMTESELENNLGTIAKSGSLAFKKETEDKKGIELIGQFGVGFYSAFMVADKITVTSKSVDSDQAYRWTSKGAEGYTIEPCEKESIGTEIVLHIKPDTDEEKYSQFLEEYTIENIVKKYSDYIRYPIKMEVEHEEKSIEKKEEKEKEVKSDEKDKKSEDKEIVETYEARKRHINPIAYFPISKISGVIAEGINVYKIESREDFIKLKNQFKVNIQGKYFSCCRYYVLDYVEGNSDYYELVRLDFFYKDFKDRVEKDKQSLEINEQALCDIESFIEKFAV